MRYNFADNYCILKLLAFLLTLPDGANNIAKNTLKIYNVNEPRWGGR